MTADWLDQVDLDSRLIVKVILVYSGRPTCTYVWISANMYLYIYSSAIGDPHKVVLAPIDIMS